MRAQVRVNTLMPGPFLADISKAWDLEEAETARRSSRWGGAASREVVGAALYLASGAPSYTTGDHQDRWRRGWAGA
jgi:NAD(P)-dependent dehydrogenase (short-subunit alcohol dehydrogenase family)